MNLKSIWAMCRTHWYKMAESASTHVSSHLYSGSPEVKGLIKHVGIWQSNKDLGLPCAEAVGSRSVVNRIGSLITGTDFYLTQKLLPIISVKSGQLAWFPWGSLVFFSSIKWKVPPSFSHLDSVRQCQSPRDTQHTWMDYLLRHCYEYQHVVFWLLSGCVQISS